ncbi:MAG TPA: prolyl oligopeptidase family serine peptidase [Ignavibacteriaceae bacterium]|nr:prolyl oligopeptidase family serine peptidase [Ignavibacteriaceae bacterium]
MTTLQPIYSTVMIFIMYHLPKKLSTSHTKVILLFLIFGTYNSELYAQFEYPAARKESFDTLIYQSKLSDDYSWMSRPENEKEMLEFAKQQGEFTNQILDSITGTELISDVLKKLDESYNPEEIIVRGVQGTQIYYYKPGREMRAILRRDGYNGQEEKVMELPIIINNKKYQSKKLSFAFKKPLLALMLVESGDANPHIRFFDLSKKEFLSDSIGPVMFNDASGVSMAWLPDDSGLIYSQAPVENSKEEDYYRGKLLLHVLEGKKDRQDVALFGKGVISGINLQDYEVPYIYSFSHSPYIIARVRAGKGDNYAFAVHYNELNGAKTNWRKLEGYKCEHGMFTAKDDFIYAVSEEVTNRQIIKVNLKTDEPPSLYLPEQENIIESIAGGKDAMYVKYISPGKSGIWKMGYSNPNPVDIALPFDGTVSRFNLVGENDLLFEITNWTKNYEYYTIEHSSNQVSLLPGGSNPNSFSESFISKVIYVPSRDGIKIPVSLVYPKAIVPGQKPLPLLIDAYGCFGISMNPEFLPEYFIWLSQGGILAVAHIRGGGELGAEWYKGGCYPTKMNSINDVVDVAQYFVDNNYTLPSQQGVVGGSCGTLNVGLATLQRPDLFSVGLYEVGIPDLVTNKGPSFGKGQNEFGPLDTEEGFNSRFSISAYYHIIENKKAPAMLMINGATDYIVPIHNVARYVAKLQNFQKSDRPTLFMVDWASGHNSAGTSLEDKIRKFKFLFWQTGNPNFQLK